jgi:hypothetical protein
MSASAALILLSTVACNKADPIDVDNQEHVAAFLGLEEDHAWTFRDDDQSGAPPPTDQLLRGRVVDGDTLDIRRGSRWADGDTELMFTLTTDAQLVLDAWQQGDASGESPLPLGIAHPANGQTVAENNWFCSTKTGALLATYYGVFDDIVQYECAGSAGPAGLFTFARDIGLVHFKAEALTLDLVAPW